MQQKIVNIEEAKSIFKDWKKNNLKIAFTNGCFDIVHMGHVDYLEKAAKCGDRLVVGINTDQSISRIKGPERPIIDEDSRSRVIAALGFISLVILFDEENPLSLIQTLLPDVLIKGNDYDANIVNSTKKTFIVGSKEIKKNGGEVITIPLIKGYSTSKIVEKIKNL